MSEPGSNTDPADDPVGTVRVHPLDDPAEATARRWLRTDDIAGSLTGATAPTPWTVITGSREVGIGDLDRRHDAMIGYPVQTLYELARVLGQRERSEST